METVLPMNENEKLLWEKWKGTGVSEHQRSRFLIVAPKNRRGQFDKVMNRTAFKDIKARVAFHSYEDILKQYELMCIARASEGFI